MAQGRKSNIVVELTDEEHQTLESWLRSSTAPAGRVRRAHIVLLRADGASISEVGRLARASPKTVYKWLRRWQQAGIAGLYDKPRPGRKPVFSPRSRRAHS